jgi:hypothetical protein
MDLTAMRKGILDIFAGGRLQKWRHTCNDEEPHE